MNKQKILVVDDEMSIRETIKDLLETTGYEVKTAGSGTEAHQLLKQFRADAVICDVMMPGMDGIELLEKVRSLPALASIPFLFLSAKTNAESVRKAMNLGADDYLMKPFRAMELIQAIEAKLARFAHLRPALEEEQAPFSDHFSRYGFHEFNTPMNNLLGSLEFLIEFGNEAGASDKQEMLQAMRASATRLRRAYTNLILYVKIIRKEPIFRPQYLSSVTEAYELALKRFSSMNVPFKHQVQIEECRLRIRTEVLELIIFELLDNALKFGNPDRLSEVSGRGSARGDTYLLAFQDYGGGMTPSQLAAIGPMVQFDRGKLEQQGWGLGLFLVKKVCEMNSLGFMIKSENGGVLVSISFPLLQPTSA